MPRSCSTGSRRGRCCTATRRLGWTLIHAGVPPQWTLEQAEACAREVERALRSDAAAMPRGDVRRRARPLVARSSQGADRLRFSVNCLTRLRFVDRKGRLLLSLQGHDRGCAGRAPCPGSATPSARRAAMRSCSATGRRSATSRSRACAASTRVASGAARSRRSASTARRNRCACPAAAARRARRLISRRAGCCLLGASRALASSTDWMPVSTSKRRSMRLPTSWCGMQLTSPWTFARQELRQDAVAEDLDELAVAHLESLRGILLDDDGLPDAEHRLAGVLVARLRDRRGPERDLQAREVGDLLVAELAAALDDLDVVAHAHVLQEQLDLALQPAAGVARREAHVLEVDLVQRPGGGLLGGQARRPRARASRRTSQGSGSAARSAIRGSSRVPYLRLDGQPVRFHRVTIIARSTPRATR